MKYVVIHQHSNSPGDPARNATASAKFAAHVRKHKQAGSLLRAWNGQKTRGYLAQAPNLAGLAGVLGTNPLAHSTVTKVIPANRAILKAHGPKVKAYLQARAAAAKAAKTTPATAAAPATPAAPAAPAKS